MLSPGCTKHLIGTFLTWPQLARTVPNDCNLVSVLLLATVEDAYAIKSDTRFCIPNSRRLDSHSRWSARQEESAAGDSPGRSLVARPWQYYPPRSVLRARR